MFAKCDINSTIEIIGSDAGNFSSKVIGTLENIYEIEN